MPTNFMAVYASIFPFIRQISVADATVTELESRHGIIITKPLLFVKNRKVVFIANKISRC